MSAAELRLRMAEASNLISVAIERQHDAPSGIDVIAYEVLRAAQGKLTVAEEEGS